MVPYQIYQALIDEHVHELHTAARRHELAAEIRRAAAGRATRASRFKGALERLVALGARVNSGAQVRSARPGSTTSAPTASGHAANESTAGPMGCCA